MIFNIFINLSFVRRPVSRTINCGSKSEIAQVGIWIRQSISGNIWKRQSLSGNIWKNRSMSGILFTPTDWMKLLIRLKIMSVSSTPGGFNCGNQCTWSISLRPQVKPGCWDYVLCKGYYLSPSWLYHPPPPPSYHVAQVSQLVDTKLNDCSLTCLVEFQREQLCSNPQVRSKIDNCIIVTTIIARLTLSQRNIIASSTSLLSKNIIARLTLSMTLSKT